MPAANALKNGADELYSPTAYGHLKEYRDKKRAELGLDDKATSKAMQTDAPTAKSARAVDDDDDADSCAFRLR